MQADQRSHLAQRQAALVAALSGTGDMPPGFAEERLRAAVISLHTKRRRAVARAWPCLLDDLRDRFPSLFDEFAAETPLPAYGGPLSDGRAFLRWLARREPLPEGVELQVLAYELRYVGSASGPKPRRGLGLKIACLRRPPRLVVGWRWLWGREHWLTLKMDWWNRPAR
jgi:hypothetical protein